MKKSSYLLCILLLALASLVALVGCDGAKVTVTLSLDGGTCAVETLTAEKGGKLQSPPSAKKEGYEFMGWYSDSALTTRWDFSTSKVQSDMTLYAGWRKADDYVTVSFVPNCNTAELKSFPSGYSIRAGETLPRPSDPVRTGYDFVCWSASGIGEWDFEFDTASSGVELTATWRKVHTLSLKDGETTIDTLKIPDGEVPAFTLAPQDGRMLMGFYEDAAFNTEIDLNKPLTADKTIYAKYMKATDSSAFKLEDWYYYGYRITGLSADFDGDTIVVPEAIDGKKVVSFTLYDEPATYPKEIYFSQHIEDFWWNYLGDAQLHFSALNEYYKTYDGCLYQRTEYLGENFETITGYYLFMIMTDNLVIHVMDGAKLNYADYSRYYVLGGRFEDHFNKEYFYAHFVVRDEYYEEYLSHADDDMKKRIIKLSEFDESAVGKEEWENA